MILDQLDHAAEKYQSRFDDGAADALKKEWNSCKNISSDCVKYCAYYAGWTTQSQQMQRDELYQNGKADAKLLQQPQSRNLHYMQGFRDGEAELNCKYYSSDFEF